MSRPSTPHPLLTAQEAAEVLGISRSRFYTLVKEEKIPKVKLGAAQSSTARFRLADLEGFIEAHTS